MSRTARAARWASSWGLRLPIAISIAYASILPLGYFLWCSAQDPPAVSQLLVAPETRSAILRTIGVTVIVVPCELIVGVLIGWRLERLPAKGAWLAALALPLFMGASYSALIWKLVLDPVSGLAGLFARVGLAWDWTASPFSALAVTAAVQAWIWSLATGAAMGALSSPEVRRTQSLFELDGAAPLAAYVSALWACRSPWLILIATAAVIETLRSFEPVYVLTQGGPGTATTTLQWAIFERSYLTLDNSGASALSLVLVALCALGLALISGLAKCFEPR